jgi:nucleotide-binding universal stress UspA family protein
MNLIVVGVDESKHARRALEWAADEARIRGARLRIVHAYQVPVSEIVHRADQYISLHDVHEAEARKVLDDALKNARDLAPQLDIVGDAVEAPPARALVEASKEADMIVVGSRGRGGFAGLLLGSVGQQTVHHATCPVVVIPPVQ